MVHMKTQSQVPLLPILVHCQTFCFPKRWETNDLSANSSVSGNCQSIDNDVFLVQLIQNRKGNSLGHECPSEMGVAKRARCESHRKNFIFTGGMSATVLKRTITLRLQTRRFTRVLEQSEQTLRQVRLTWASEAVADIVNKNILNF